MPVSIFYVVARRALFVSAASRLLPRTRWQAYFVTPEPLLRPPIAENTGALIVCVALL
ncbi:MAG: hypothetical protein ACRDV4_12295 [Acidimicrobiales bacterium]